jgi:hypothetical protein
VATAAPLSLGMQVVEMEQNQARGDSFRIARNVRMRIRLSTIGQYDRTV